MLTRKRLMCLAVLFCGLTLTPTKTRSMSPTGLVFAGMTIVFYYQALKQWTDNGFSLGTMVKSGMLGGCGTGTLLLTCLCN